MMILVSMVTHLGGTAVQWLVLSAVAFLSGVCIFSPCLCAKSKDMQDELNDNSNLRIGVNASVGGCLSLYVSAVIDW